MQVGQWQMNMPQTNMINYSPHMMRPQTLHNVQMCNPMMPQIMYPFNRQLRSPMINQVPMQFIQQPCGPTFNQPINQTINPPMQMMYYSVMPMTPQQNVYPVYRPQMNQTTRPCVEPIPGVLMRAAEAKTASAAMNNQAVNIQPKQHLVHQNSFTPPSIHSPSYSIQTAHPATIFTPLLSPQSGEQTVKQIPIVKKQLARPTPTRPTISAFRSVLDSKSTAMSASLSPALTTPTAVHAVDSIVRSTQKRRRELSSNDNEETEQSDESRLGSWTKKLRKGGKVALQQTPSRSDFTNNSIDETSSSDQFSFTKSSKSKSSFESTNQSRSSAVTSGSKLLFAFRQTSFDQTSNSKTPGFVYSDEEDMSSVTIASSRDDEAAFSPVSLSPLSDALD